MPASTIRAFIAIELSAGLRQQLGRVAAQLQKDVPNRVVNWVRPDLIHLTLKFLGDTPDEAVPKIAGALDAVAAQTPPFTITTGQLGCFPNLRQPRVIWVGFEAEASARLIKLAQAVEAATAPLGFPTEPRPFSPHLTLGRVRREAAPRPAATVGHAITAAGPIEGMSDSVQSITLMKSDLRPGGPVYTTMHKAQFSVHN